MLLGTNCLQVCSVSCAAAVLLRPLHMHLMYHACRCWTSDFKLLFLSCCLHEVSLAVYVKDVSEAAYGVYRNGRQSGQTEKDHNARRPTSCVSY